MVNTHKDIIKVNTDIFENKAYELQLKKIIPTLLECEFSIKPSSKLSFVTFSFTSPSGLIFFYTYLFLSQSTFLNKGKTIVGEILDTYNNLEFDSEEYKRFFSQQMKDKIILKYGYDRDLDETEALWIVKRTELMQANPLKKLHLS